MTLQSQGMTGFTLQEQFNSYEKMKNHPRFKFAWELTIDIMFAYIKKHMKLTELRKIARKLIKAGADVNAEHKSPINGYTPLMLAAENNEREIFELMLTNGGDLYKTYTDSSVGREISISEIAFNFKSRDILLVLDDISKVTSLI